MNKYNIKELAEKLERCRNVNLDDIKLEEVDEITEERILDFIMKAKKLIYLR